MQLPGLNIGIIADDLTGACDAALQFFSSKTSPHILLTSEWSEQLAEKLLSAEDSMPGHQVWSINTHSRHLNAEKAVAQIDQAVKTCQNHLGIENFYKKIDSTLRGNIAQECLAVLEAIEGHCAVIAPAYPQEGRRTVGGYQLVRGIPIEKTVVARDPLFPVRQSHIPALLASMVEPKLVGYIPLSLVLHGAGPILLRLKELIQDGKKLVVIDATSTEDLEQIALAIQNIQKSSRILPCGSAGLAKALAAQWQSKPETDQKADIADAVTLPESPILIVSGSNTDTTRQQLTSLVENYTYFGQGSQLRVFDLTAEQLLGLSPVEKIVEQVVEALGRHNTVLLSSAFKEGAYAKTIELAQEHQLSPQEASQKAQTVLANMTVAITQTRPTTKLILTGGETTESVCNALNIQALQVVAEAHKSIPLLSDKTGRCVVSKSGGFGNQVALASVIKFLKQRELSSTHAG